MDGLTGTELDRAAFVLHDDELLLSVNLIHDHSHRHGDVVHSHPHDPSHHEAADHELAAAVPDVTDGGHAQG